MKTDKKGALRLQTHLLSDRPALSGLAGPDYDATISFGLPFEPEDSQYGKYRTRPLSTHRSRKKHLGQSTYCPSHTRYPQLFRGSLSILIDHLDIRPTGLWIGSPRE